MKKNIVIGVAIMVVVIAIMAAVYIPKQGSPPGDNVEQRLAACRSLPNGSTENATETSRLFINLPKNLYPDINLQITPHGAAANYISNGGQYGYALGAQGKTDCWSYYFEFDLASTSQVSGSVDIGSKSGMNGIPDYLIHINVAGLPAASSTSTPSLEGNIQGQVFLRPTCPVERIPPDPSCAPRPYQTTIVAFKTSNTLTPFMTTTSNASGTFTLLLNPGAYVLRADGGAVYPRCTDTPIQVVAGKPKAVTINCDTGIR